MRRFVLGAVLSICAATSQAGVVVVPNSLTAVEGDANNSFPFNLAPFGRTSQRYQQIYAGTEFGGGGLITQIAFRPDWQTGAFSSTISNIRIDLSTTSQLPDALDSTFANNVGADDAIVFNGSLSLSSAFTGPASGPKAFDIIINLTTPFAYNPGSGNLLLDVRNFSGETTTSFDATNVTGDAVSRLASGSTDGVGDAAGSSDSLGLVTRFTITPSGVPEPGTLSLLSLGALALVGWRFIIRRA